MNPAHAEAPKTPPLDRPSGPPMSYGPQKPYLGPAPVEADRVPPPAAASPEAELKPPPAEQPKADTGRNTTSIQSPSG